MQCLSMLRSPLNEAFAVPINEYFLPSPSIEEPLPRGAEPRAQLSLG